MNPTDVLAELQDMEGAVEVMVLLREVKITFQFEQHFMPTLRIKIYLSTVPDGFPYTFDTSHHVHTPEQAGPYLTSHPWARTESEAITHAIRGFRMYIVGAINAGHSPSDSWLVENEDF